MDQSQEWFIERIGKRIFRDDNQCPCHHCKEITITGLVIHDRQHAIYLADIAADTAAEGTILNYRDTK